MTHTVLAAIGEALIDFIPDKTGCDFDAVTAFSPAVGGAPANVCAAFARLGGQSRLFSQLGDDPFGHKIRRELAACGIDTRYIRETDRANTALAFVSLAADGDRTFSFYRNPSADMLYAPDDLDPVAFDDLFCLHFCSVSLGDFPMKEAHRRAIALAHARDALVSFDPNLRFPLWRDPADLHRAVQEFLPLADILKVSEEELPFITGEPDRDRAVATLFQGRVQLVLCTCGAGGAYAYTSAAKVYCPAAAVSAVDTTGAGDGFIGAFLWKLQQHGVSRNTLAALDSARLTDCLAFADRFCAVSIRRHGAIPSYPTWEEVQCK